MSRITWGMLLALLPAGCSGGGDTHSVSGIVTLDGKPIEGASVVFSPVADDGALAAGTTNAEGRYELRRGEQDGARAGQYKVAVQLTKTVGQRKDPDSDDDLKTTYVVPQKFSDPETSGLTAEVPGNEPYDFRLTSRQAR